MKKEQFEDSEWRNNASEFILIHSLKWLKCNTFRTGINT